jgi:hypothetical protein
MRCYSLSQDGDHMIALVDVAMNPWALQNILKISSLLSDWRLLGKFS